MNCLLLFFLRSVISIVCVYLCLKLSFIYILELACNLVWDLTKRFIWYFFINKMFIFLLIYLLFIKIFKIIIFFKIRHFLYWWITITFIIFLDILNTFKIFLRNLRYNLWISIWFLGVSSYVFTTAACKIWKLRNRDILII